MIHRFIDGFHVCDYNLVFITSEASPNSFFSVWKAGYGCPPERFDTSIISSLNSPNDHLADPERSPDGTQVIYSRVGHNIASPNRKSSIRIVDYDDTNNTELYGETGGQLRSLTPTWKPDGTKILFRAKAAGAGADVLLIKHMDPDGTNVATLYTGAAIVLNPLYNHDGTLIAFTENGALNVMNADGTGLSTIVAANASAPTWANTSDTIAYINTSGSRGWRKIAATGGAVTTLTSNWTTNDPSTIKWSWVPDDTAIATTVLDGGADHDLILIATDGSGFTVVSPGRKTPVGTPDTRPVVLGDRIYFPDTATTPLTQLSSVLLDGSGYRTDFDGVALTPDVTFHGFKGDTVNI